ncbi:SIS domain-containing protein [Myxacorys almedinensis]|nr:SIS domain-containing protein [Myxacorys almedinensis]
MALQREFQHFMLKEIYEQPESIGRGVAQYVASLGSSAPSFHALPEANCFEEIQILACGTSLHAALVGQFVLEQVAQIPTRVRSASEFLAAPLPVTRQTLLIVVSQSGETADVLAAMRLANQQSSSGLAGFKVFAITNNSHSAIAQQADYERSVGAGVENSVAATKTFTAQLVLFYGLALAWGRQRDRIPDEQWVTWQSRMAALPSQVDQVLQQDDSIAAIARSLKHTNHIILLGTGINYPIALEGALKLKETTYTHAEGYAAGEFLHGSIALLDHTIPTIALCPTPPFRSDPSLENPPSEGGDQMLKVTQRIRRNGSDVIAIGGSEAAIALPLCDQLLSPFLTVIPLQLLAYHLAIARNIEVDRPRNITKSLNSF